MNQGQKQPPTALTVITSARSVSAVSVSTVATLKATFAPKQYSMVVPWEPVPAPEELNALATQIATITQDIHEARLHGFLAKALGVASQMSGKMK